MTDTAPAPAPTPTATPAPPAAPAGEEAELLALHANDPQVFEHAPFKDTGRTGAERLYDLRRASQPKSGEQDAAEQTEDDDGLEVDGIDLDAPAGDDAAETGEPEAAGLDLQWDRGDFIYAPPEGTEVTETGQQRIDAFAEFAHRANMPPEAYEGAINWYNDLVAKEQARLVEADKTASVELTKSLKAELGDTYQAFSAELAASFKALDPDLRSALRSARLPTGEALMTRPDVVRLIHGLGARPGQPAAPQPYGDRRVTIQRELDEIDQAMNQDVANLYKNWKATGQMATDYKLTLLRELDGTAPSKPSAADVHAELRELETLRARDPQLYSLGSWRTTGRPGAERHAALLRRA